MWYLFVFKSEVRVLSDQETCILKLSLTLLGIKFGTAFYLRTFLREEKAEGGIEVQDATVIPPKAHGGSAAQGRAVTRHHLPDHAIL